MSDDKNIFKESLNLPKTTFDMKAGLLAKEPVIQARWKADNLYGQIRKASAGNERFILHDGPPYANGNIHMGHALNKVLKDMVVRIKNMTGFDAPYIHGWDCHGLPIEQKVMENLGEAAATMSAVDIRRRCHAYAKKFVGIQSEQFQRLGLMGEFDEPYLTLNKPYEAAELEVLAKLVENGIVRKQLKPVHWSIENRTALADAELEHKDRTDTSIFVAFELTAVPATLPHKEGQKVSLAIWTTTPWTLPANRAVAVHPDFEYACVSVNSQDGSAIWIVAEKRLEALLASINSKRPGWLVSHEITGKIGGAKLAEAGLTYKHPIDPLRSCPVVTALYVTLEDGTGLVHTAPGHGIEDYGTGLKHHLEICCPVGPDGTFDDTVPQWLRGVNVWKSNALIVERLRGAGVLLVDEQITHSYPHDWRSKTPTIFRATEQWFVGVDTPTKATGRSLREMAMNLCRRTEDDGGVQFVPSWGRNRIAGMLESRPDWCISRQRSWGLPIPAFYNQAGEPLMTPASIRAVAKVFAEQGSDAWFSLSPRELLEAYDLHKDKDLKNAADFPIDQLTKGTDTLDVWFDSGSSWFAVAISRGLVKDIPVNLYLEGSDQHRGWFQTSLLLALGAAGKAPYQAVLTHGYVVDEDGRTKMSKSLGNTMNVVDQLKKRGADVLRLWVATQNYQEDIRCGDKLIAQAEDAYRKIRNTLRFCMGACSDFDAAHHATEPADHSVDLWMKMELHLLIRDVRGAYDRYEFHRAARLIYEFCTVQASSIYLSAVKDRLYCESPNALRRRATQTVIHQVLMTLVKLLAPILPHTCEEAWEHIPFRDPGQAHSVHLTRLPDYDPEVLALAEDLRVVNPDQGSASPERLEGGPAYVWQRLMDLRAEGLGKLEALRNAGVKNSLDAEAVFKVAAGKDNVAAVIETYLKELEDLLGVGYARMEKGAPLPEGQDVAVEVGDTREKYQRCERSWKRRPDVGSDADFPTLSARDAVVMKDLAGQ
ncbi:MAG: isoleucine--tRNA ligase [Phycisphaerae bacterium]|jgi:isoleucyl-tRNA synthetase